MYNVTMKINCNLPYAQKGQFAARREQSVTIRKMGRLMQIIITVGVNDMESTNTPRINVQTFLSDRARIGTHCDHWA